MSGAEQLVGWFGNGVLLLTLVGMVVRRRHRVCYSFAVYLAATMIGDALPLLWPERFYFKWFYLSKELVIHVLRFAVALELSYRTFRAFPGARSTARGLLLFLLIISLVAVVAGTQGLPTASDTPPEISVIISQVQPRVLNGAIWLLTGIAAVILWYRLPVDSFHKAILTGLVPYLLIFTASLNLIDSWGWDVRVWINYVLTSAFLLVLGYWARAAWQPARAPARVAAAAIVEGQAG